MRSLENSHFGYAKFHALYFTLRGNSRVLSAKPGNCLDIADEFSQLARSLGFEGPQDSYAGLWSTQFVYDDHSLLSGDFLARGLHVDLLCSSSAPIPFASIFLCLQETLRRIAQCEITELTIVCTPYSVGMRNIQRNTTGDLQAFNNLWHTPTPLPIAKCSTLHFSFIHKKQKKRCSNTTHLPMEQLYLSELALPVSALWAEHIESSLNNVETVHITIT